MKKITILLPILVLLSFTPVAKPVWAESGATIDAQITKAAGRLIAIPTKIAQRQDTELAKLQQKASTMIDERITTLNALLSRIQSDTRLSDTDKTTLTTNINNMISNLQSLKAKIAADTDVTTARTDAKSIVTSYHVFATFEPETRLLTIVSNLQTTAGNLQNLVPLLQNLSSTLKSQGKDTTTIDAAITDISTQLTNINTTLASDKTKLDSIATSTNDNQATFTQIRQDLAKVKADFAQIRHDIATMRGAIHTLVGESKLKTNASGSAQPTTSPTSSAQ